MGCNLPKIAAGIADGAIKTLIVFGEDVTKVGLGANLLAKLDTLIVSDILPNKTTALAHYLLPGCAHAEKRGSFVNAKGRVQRFMQNIQPKGDARPEWDFLRELAPVRVGRFFHHRGPVQPDGGRSARLPRPDLGGFGRLGRDRADLRFCQQ